MTLMSILLTLACTSSGTVVLGDDSGENDTGEVDTGEVEPDPNPAAGDYDGELTWSIPDWGQEGWTVCEMDFSLEVDDEGAFTQDDICEYNARDGSVYDLEISLEGQVDEDGDVTGEISFMSWAVEGWSSYYIESYSSELEGQADGDELTMEFYDEAQMGNNGELEMPGSISLER